MSRRLLQAVAIAGAILLVVLNFWLFTVTQWHLPAGPAADWTSFVEAGRRITSGGDVYSVEADYAFRYSPLLAYVFAFLAPMGVLAWRLIHVLALAGMVMVERRLWPMALLLAVSWPFWFDIEAGNLMTFVVVSGALALRDSRWGTAAYLVFALLVPRPLMLPLLAWLLWQRPQWRVPFLAMLVASILLTVPTGLLGTWVGALVNSADEVGSILNFGPSRAVGPAWVPIGLVLAAWLTWRGRLGLASLAASPYWFPYYFAVLAWETVRPTRKTDA